MEANPIETNIVRINYRNAGRADRRYNNDHHLGKKIRICKYSYRMGYVDEKDGKHIHFSKNNDKKKYLKRYSNKFVRKIKDVPNGNWC